MPWELIYTSAPRGLRAGASGYCTVAQSRGLREDLAAALERRSLFAHETRGESPFYFSFRNLSIGGSTWRVLSRATDAGLDFTGRRHFLIHHLVLDSEWEVGHVQPVDLLLGWKGWKEKWEGPPAELPTVGWQDVLAGLPRIRLPAHAWSSITGDAGWATAPHRLASPVAWLTESLAPQDLLRLMGESLAIVEWRQAGKSWLTPLDAGGASNPVSKDCHWAGRTLWRGEGTPIGARSVLRVDKCRGEIIEGRTEEMFLARTGWSASDVKKDERVSTLLVPHPSEEGTGHFRSRETEVRWSSSWRWMVPILFLGFVGLVWLLVQRPVPVVRETADGRQGRTGPIERWPRQEPVTAHSMPAAPISPGRNLSRILWAEAGGEESIVSLQFLYGETLSSAVVENEVEWLLRDGAEAGSARGPEGTISLETMEQRRRFGREAAKYSKAWSLYLPGVSRGLAYVPDLGRNLSQRTISAQGCSPQQILEELGHRIFLEPKRWSIRIEFPSSADKQFLPLRILYQEDDSVWVSRVEQHRAQLLGDRLAALKRIAPFFKVDPEQLEEAEIQRILRAHRGAETDSADFAALQGREEDYQPWKVWPEPGSPPAGIFGRLLSTPRVEAWLELDNLAVSRLRP